MSSLIVELLFILITGFEPIVTGSGESCCRITDTTLDCNHCSLTELPMPLMDSNITKLDLSHNSISTILPGSFEHMTSLKTLYFAYNPLHGLNNETFRGE